MKLGAGLLCRLRKASNFPRASYLSNGSGTLRVLWLKHDLPPEVLTHVCKVPFAIERFHGSPKLGCGHFQGAVILSATRGLGHGQLRDGILSARQGLGCGHLWGRVLPTTMTILVPLRFMALYCHLQFLGQTFLQGTGPGSGGRLRAQAPSQKMLSTRFPLRVRGTGVCRP